MNRNNALFDVGQIRLAELSVFNWGSFNGLHTAKIDPHGTLVTGDNGSGKTTFIDGLMALLLPAGRATFNVAAAQGDRSDRTLLSYMRGSFGSVHDGSSTRVKSKREGAVVTGLRVLYKGDDGSCITLSAIFWTTQSSNALSDVKRVYVVAKRNLPLKEILDSFGEGNARSMKNWLRNDPSITCCDDRFSDYQALYRKLLYMDNKNAPSLLSRALGLKKIDDLTELIRELVLEPSTVKDDAKKVVEEFSDLVAIHSKLIDARAQKEHLGELPKLNRALVQTKEDLACLINERDGLVTYFGMLSEQLWHKKVANLQTKLEALSLLIKQVTEQESDANLLAEQRHEDYIKVGGGRIEGLKNELNLATNRLDRITIHSSRYQTHVRILGLNEELREAQFIKNQSQVEERLSRIKNDNRTAQDVFGNLSGQLSRYQSEKKEVEKERADIAARPDSNIDLRFQKLRDELAESLGMEREKCIFIGELIDVAESQHHWQGAIERALGGLRTTLAVPEDCFSMVTRWLNTRHTGLHVRVQVVREHTASTEFKDNGFLKKLVWRKHPYREWLKKHLSRFDLLCVSSMEELNSTPFSMTQQGLMQMDKGRFEKKDQHKIDDRRRWQLGFSNQSRLAILQSDQKALKQKVTDTLRLVEKARKDWDAISELESTWKKLQEYQWEDINAPYWTSKIAKMKEDVQMLELAGSNLEKARQRWEDAKQTLAEIRKTKEQRKILEGELKGKLGEADVQQKRAANAAKHGLDDAVRALLDKRIGALKESDLEKVSSMEYRFRQNIEKSLEKRRTDKGRYENVAIGIMSSFRQKWEVIAADWRCDMASLEEYLDYLQALEKEGLPRLVEQFTKRLNKHATQSLARIRQRLDSERDDILERIDTINQVLVRTEFREGSHLKLGTKTEKYPHVIEFNKHISKVLSQATSEDYEARFQQLKRVVEILEKACNPSTSGTLESMRLLDPRYQMSFYAEELDVKTHEILDVLESSSGKSGGEKESFAGTIVAASLAYVLTPDGFDRPVYCTVFLDEAFSNTAEAVSRRVLRVFKELHIHVNLITPYKNLNLARESARSLLIAERNQEKHESHLCEVTWEEVERQLNKKHEANRLGIKIHPNVGVE
ncbi:FIG007317: Chromosome segregation protein SMC-like [hydrothermal vent metagenome]|uniref:FIG007317: Chromosome segregation protein SMC-like n=1 Tax=hydrothermal vent metagenome TaxID=652676 RepID=A0A3B0WBG3_9ZZZZ